MKALVKVPFIDKYTGKFYREETVIEATPERVAEMGELVQPMEEAPAPKPKAKKATRKK